MLGQTAAARRPTIDRHELTDHIAVAKDHQPGWFSTELQVLRHQTDRGHRENIQLPSPIVCPAVRDRRLADLAVAANIGRSRRWKRQKGQSQYRHQLRAAGWTSASGMECRRPSCATRRTAQGSSKSHHQLRLGQPPRRRCWRQPFARAIEVRRAPKRHLQLQAIAGHDLPPELRLVDAPAPRPWPPLPVAPNPCVTGSSPPARASRSSARPASTARRENAPERNPR